MKITAYKPGSFNWTDHAATDLTAAKASCGELFSWKVTERDAGEAGVYAMAYVDDKPVGAFYGMNDEMKGQGVPSHWVAYISVGDADAAASRTPSAGTS